MMLPREPGDVAWSVAEDEETLTLATSQLRLVIQKATGAFTWLDCTGAVLVREPAGGGKTLEEVPVEVTIFAADAEVKTEESVDGGRTTIEASHKVVDRTAYASKLELEFSPGEALYGLGQHEEGILNYRGHSQTLYQHNMKLAVPVLVSTQGYALLWDTYSLSVFHDDEHGSYFWSDIDAEMDFYFIYGPEFDQIIAEYRALTGQAPMLPKWATATCNPRSATSIKRNSSRWCASTASAASRWTASCRTGRRGPQGCGGRRASIQRASPTRRN